MILSIDNLNICNTSHHKREHTFGRYHWNGAGRQVDFAGHSDYSSRLTGQCADYQHLAFFRRQAPYPLSIPSPQILLSDSWRRVRTLGKSGVVCVGVHKRSSRQVARSQALICMLCYHYNRCSGKCIAKRCYSVFFEAWYGSFSLPTSFILPLPAMQAAPREVSLVVPV